MLTSMLGEQSAVEPATQEHSSGEGAGSMDVLCGIDWAEGHYDVALIDDVGKVLAKCRINDDLGGSRLLLNLLAEQGDTA